MSGKKEEQVIQTKQNTGISGALNQYFHFIEKGSAMGSEVKSGLSVFFLSVCALFMNIQILIQAFSDDIPYCGLYLGATATAFAGTLILGLVCNLPLVQTASLSLSTVMISMLGVDSGLTYANLLAVTFVAAVVYLAVMAVPMFRKWVLGLLPDSVRRALPAAMGLYIAYAALENMGIIEGMSLSAASDDALGGAALAPYMRLCIFAGLIGFALVLFYRKRKAETPVFSGFLTATLIFFLIASVAGGIAFTYVYTQNRIWIGVNPDPLGEMYTIGLGIRELQLGTVFAEGFDFSGFTAAGGNVVLLFVRAILMFVFMGMYESEASVQGADLNGQIFENEEEYREKSGKILLVNAVTNVIAPVLGAAPVSVAKQSSAATADGGKTGLSSVVCAAGYLISMFTWLPFVLFATYTKSVPEYGHAGFVFPNVIYAAFQIADAVMLALALGMLKGFRNLKDMEAEESIPFAVTVVMTVFTQNIAYGAAAGCVVSVFLVLAGLRKKEIRIVPASRYVMAVLAVILLTVSMAAPTLGGSAAASGETGSENGGADGQAGGTSAKASENTAGYTFDGATGDFVFTGSADVDYYTVWVYGLDGEGNEGSNYVAASQRLTGKGEISGNVDISGLPFGSYHANLLTFRSDGNSDEPVVQTFEVSGKLSTPEFKYIQDGTSVTVTLWSDTLTAYNEKELFTDIEIRIYDKSGETVQTETITEEDLIATAMGPMTSYSCEKEITVEAGEYKISLTAAGDGNLAEASEESEQVELVVAEGADSEGQTANYAEAEGGPMP